MTNSSRTAGWAALILVAAGCDSGPPMGDVSGTVTVDGKSPAAGSSLTFLPTDNVSTTTGCVVEDGHYSARVPVGTVKVQIRAPRVIDKPQRKSKDAYQAEGSLVTESLPAKYNDATTLTLEVTPGTVEKNWDLTTK